MPIKIPINQPPFPVKDTLLPDMVILQDFLQESYAFHWIP